MKYKAAPFYQRPAVEARQVNNEPEKLGQLVEWLAFTEIQFVISIDRDSAGNSGRLVRVDLDENKYRATVGDWLVLVGDQTILVVPPENFSSEYEACPTMEEA